MNLNPNYYDILKIEMPSNEDEIKSAYRGLAKKYHPDKNGGDLECEEKMKQIAEAYYVLKDANRKAKYDQSIKTGQFYDFSSVNDMSEFKDWFLNFMNSEEGREALKLVFDVFGKLLNRKI